jgi:hypothetical protein
VLKAAPILFIAKSPAFTVWESRAFTRPGTVVGVVVR